MMNKAATLGLSMALLAGTSVAEEGPTPKGVPHLNHVFVIMMENHGYSQIVDNPNAPFVNKFAKYANKATNYFAIAHPSLTNYLEVVGGSNFGIHTDNYPDWHSTSCATNLSTGIVATDTPPSPLICPIAGSGIDAATTAQDFTNEVGPGSPPINNIDGKQSFAADKNTTGKTIADQLVAQGLSWKTYQESLPLSGADMVNVSDGFFTNNTDFAQFAPATKSDLVYLYAVKHNPFAYFRDIQEGENPRNSLKNVVSFEGLDGLYANLATGEVPTYSFIAPNQCNDQHGRGNAGAFCGYDPANNGTQAGLNMALLQRGDITVQRLVTAIKSSPVWKDGGRTAIVLLWDEDDYSVSPTVNQVLLVVDTNYGNHGLQSGKRYNHFSLLKTIEAGLHLPCLNHACDSNDVVPVMSDLFSRGDQDSDDQ